MNDRILLVDDEPRLLDGLRRTLRGRYAVSTAGSGAEGLAALTTAIDEGNPFAVVVSDMMMPGMSGPQFLGQARTLTPDTVLMVLSGQADLASTIAAVNQANLFRFLTKPCDPDDLTRALDAALRQHQLVTAERELLQNTLTGAVDMLTDVLSMASPNASRRTERTRFVIRTATDLLSLTDDWRLPVAAMLSHIGCIAVPTHVIEMVDAGQEPDPAEREMWDQHPQVGQRLLARIPRLEAVAEWVGAQPTSVEAADAAGTGAGDDPAGCLLPAVAGYLVHHDARTAPREAIRRLERTRRYTPAVLEAVLTAAGQIMPRGAVVELKVSGLRPGMVIHQDVRTTTGLTLVKAGERVTEVMVSRLTNFAASVGVIEPFKVIADTPP